MSWSKAFLVMGVAGALFVQVYFDARVPEPIKEKWTVKLLDVMLKTYGHLVSIMDIFGYGGPYSPNARKLADAFILLQTTGSPWGLGDGPELKIHDDVYDGIPVRMYEPVVSLKDSRRPVVIYFHGGGWCLLSVVYKPFGDFRKSPKMLPKNPKLLHSANIDSHDPLTRKLAKDTGYVVISVDYRLAPQHPYPAALDDCLKVVEYVIEKSREMGIDAARIAVAGDSAGGNLAAAVSLRLKELIRLQIIIVPALQVLSFNTTSFIENADYLRKSVNDPNTVLSWMHYAGVDPEYLSDFLANNHTSKELKNSKYIDISNPDKLVPKYYIRTLALRNTEERKDFGNEELWGKIKDRLLDPYLAPLMADDALLRRTAQAYVMTAGYDIIRDDGIMYSSRLKAAGVKTVIRNFPDAFHHAVYFHSGPLRVNVGTRIVRDITNFLTHNL